MLEDQCYVHVGELWYFSKDGKVFASLDV